jgi:calcineurin-like phosphoesterase family protein
MASWFQRLPGRKRLIPGNHDEVHGMHRDAHRNLLRASWAWTFESIQAFARIRIAGQSVLLSHLPYPGTSEGTDSEGRPFDDRYQQWRLPNLGVPLLHGHTHRNERLSWNSGTPQIHIGVDAWDFAPVSLSAVELILKSTQEDKCD